MNPNTKVNMITSDNRFIDGVFNLIGPSPREGFNVHNVGGNTKKKNIYMEVHNIYGKLKDCMSILKQIWYIYIYIYACINTCTHFIELFHKYFDATLVECIKNKYTYVIHVY